MPVLTLKFKKDDRQLGEFFLESGKSITIGRLDDNDVVVENLAVSGHHARIDSVGDNQFVLIDLHAKNGTFVNEERITKHVLKQGDVIMIGKHHLVFAYNPGESQPASDGGAVPADTMVMDTAEYRRLMEKNKEKTYKESEEDAIGVLSFLSGGEGELELRKKLTKIGKNPSSDIVVSGLLVGETAATISSRPNGYYLSYVGGIAKPKVNSKAVKDSVLLNQFDIIEIGSVKIQFIHK